MRGFWKALRAPMFFAIPAFVGLGYAGALDWPIAFSGAALAALVARGASGAIGWHERRDHAFILARAQSESRVVPFEIARRMERGSSQVRRSRDRAA